MPTLLQINVASNYGSTGKIAEQIGLLALENGWNSFIAHGARYMNPSALQTIQISNKIGEFMHGFVYSLLFDKHGLGSANDTKKFINLISNQIKPDIIHLHNIHGYYLNYKLLFEFLSTINVPVVWTLHDCWPFTGHCCYFDFEGCTRWKTGCFSCPLIRTYPKSLFADNSTFNYLLKKECFTSLKDKLTLVPVSFWLENLLKQSFLRNISTHTIHNGIDTKIFRPTLTNNVVCKYNLHNKTVLLGVASPWTFRKGFLDFLKIRLLLPENYIILMVGLSDKQISQLPSGIIGIKRTQNVHELAELYTVANFFINPTYEDNYPTVNLEAISCGTPVITYNTGGSPEAVGNQTGTIVEKGDVQAIVNAIHFLEQKNQEELRQDCLEYSKKYFDRITCFQKYIDLYNSLLNI